MNFVEHAGISLTAACFSNNRYIAGPAQRCFSNLLAIGFHRYEIDVYWDASRRLWSLCPAEMGGADESTDQAAPVVSQAIQTSVTGQDTDLSMVQMSSQINTAGDQQRRQATAVDSSLDGDTLPQAPSTSAAVNPVQTSLMSSTPSTVSASANSTASSRPMSGDYRRIGPFACSEAVDLNWLSRIMWTYLDTTETNLNATLRYMILNVHAAAPASDPSGGAQQPSSDDLPSSGDLLSSIVSSNLSSFLYTRSELREQRANIDENWYAVPAGMGPNTEYYDIRVNNGIGSTPDGWPSENYVEMQEGKRLFVGFGSVDPQMQGYDVSRDNDIMFPQEFLQSNRQLTVNADGQVSSGCFYQPREYSISSVNNSWALTLNPPLAQPDLLLSSSNITRCGISPILNSTLQNATADQNFLPYQTYLQSTIWSWAPDYPRAANISLPISEGDDNGMVENSDTDEDLGSQNRCAALNATSGFWQNIVCDTSHYSACRASDSIYDWSISEGDTTYTKAGISCPEGSQFDVPRTGLQSTYLLNTWRAHLADPSTDSDPNDPLLWLNFNNLHSEPCWVVGQNSTCPYVNRRSGDRRVIVPVVAAVVVFALGVMTVFVKCAANRQMNKRQKRRRRRGDDGWDYEGVPS